MAMYRYRLERCYDPQSDAWNSTGRMFRGTDFDEGVHAAKQAGGSSMSKYRLWDLDENRVAWPLPQVQRRARGAGDGHAGPRPGSAADLLTSVLEVLEEIRDLLDERLPPAEFEDNSPGPFYAADAEEVPDEPELEMHERRSW